MGIFGGFWRDGAVVKPIKKHLDSRGYVVLRNKSDREPFTANSLYLHDDAAWAGREWLDTAAPTELSPAEAFELLKILFPMLTEIEKDRNNDYTMKSDRYVEANINWGDMIEYPPKRRWKVPTDSDRGKPCRYKDNEDGEWYENDNRVFWSTWPNGYLLQLDGKYAEVYRLCEVVD